MVPPKAVQPSGVFWFQVSGVSVQVLEDRDQMTEDRKQKSDRVLHLPVFTICLLSSVV